MTRTIKVKQAKPSQQDFDCVHDFLQGIECILEEDYIPGDNIDDEPIERATPDRIVEWLEQKWRAVGGSWLRVLWAGKTAIDNCCDPNADVLEFKPEILQAMKNAARWEYCRQIAHCDGPSFGTWKLGVHSIESSPGGFTASVDQAMADNAAVNAVLAKEPTP